MTPPSPPALEPTSGSAAPPGALTAPAATRNRGPIAAMLRARLPRHALVLEIASGSGEHAMWFAADLPETIWQPTDIDPERLASIAAWRESAGPPNLRAPLRLDASKPATWPVAAADAVVAINMVHIAPWAATEGLIEGAARVLPPGGVLALYGPFRIPGVPTAPSNEEFDVSLRERDPAWGIRDLDAIAAQARSHGLELVATEAMPANNRFVAFRKARGVAEASLRRLSLAQLNAAAAEDVAAALAPVFERAPWITRDLATARPFVSLAALHESMMAVLRAAPRETTLAFLRGHPALSPATLRGVATAESVLEQRSAGLHELDDAATARLDAANAAYHSRFGHPFILAVRGKSFAAILASLKRRLAADSASEWDETLREIGAISWMRLLDRVEAEATDDTPL